MSKYCKPPSELARGVCSNPSAVRPSSSSGRENSVRRAAPSMDGFHSGRGRTFPAHGRTESGRGRNSQTGFRPTDGLFPAVGG